LKVGRERRDFDRDRLVLGFGDAFGIGDAAEVGGPLETRNALEADEAGVGGDALKTGAALGIGDVLEARGEADFDFGDGGFGDPIGGEEQKFDSFDSDSFDAKLELTCAYESACSCDDPMPLISGDSSAFREIWNFWHRGRGGGRRVEEVAGVDRLDPPVDAGIDTF
jgi:hypothetical protein